MEIIVSSKRLGTYFDVDGTYDVYAEVCKLPHLDHVEWVSRLVECPENLPDKLMAHKGGMRTEREAADNLANMVVSYNRKLRMG